MRKPRGLQPHARLISRVLQRFLHQLVRLRLFHVQALGRENIPRKGAAIVACNHISLADPVVVWGSLPRTAVAVAMKELWRTPMVFLMWTLGHIPVDRSSRASGAKVKAKMQSILRANGLLLIFPEGKCSKDGQLLPLKAGATDLAFATNTPVIPAGLAGTSDVWPLGRRRINRKRHIVVVYGTALTPSNYSSAQEMRDALSWSIRQLTAHAVNELNG